MGDARCLGCNGHKKTCPPECIQDIGCSPDDCAYQTCCSCTKPDNTDVPAYPTDEGVM
jgi:hypothetical protein